MNLPFEFFLALRYLQPKRTFVSVITLLSLMGVALGVMVLIVVISVMSGFEKDLREKVMGFTAHVTVTNYGIVDDPEPILKMLDAETGVLGASPFVSGPVMVEFNSRISTPFIRGVNAEREQSVLGLKKYIEQGEFLLEGEAAIVGIRFAEKNNIKVGDKILVFAPRDIEALKRAVETGQKTVYLPTELLVTGIFSTGMFDYDSNFILTSIAMAQRFYNLNNGVHGIAIRLKDPMKADELKYKLDPQLKEPIRAYTWMDLNSQLFSAIAVERNVMFFLLLFIIIVAAFGLCSTLITLTVQKSREIGLMKALGATEFQAGGVFLVHGLVVGIAGSLLGLGSGLLLLQYRNQAASFLARTLGIEIFPYEVYQFAAIPSVVNESNLLLICVSAVLICVVAALIPAWRAACLQPSEALRGE